MNIMNIYAHNKSKVRANFAFLYFSTVFCGEL